MALFGLAPLNPLLLGASGRSIAGLSRPDPVFSQPRSSLIPPRSPNELDPFLLPFHLRHHLHQLILNLKIRKTRQDRSEVVQYQLSSKWAPVLERVVLLVRMFISQSAGLVLLIQTHLPLVLCRSQNFLWSLKELSHLTYQPQLLLSIFVPLLYLHQHPLPGIVALLQEICLTLMTLRRSVFVVCSILTLLMIKVYGRQLGLLYVGNGSSFPRG